MSYLDKMLEGIEVEWKTFGKIATIQRGASPRPIANFITNDENGIPWIKIGDTSSASKYVEKSAQKITLAGAKQSRVLKKGDLIMSNSMSFGRPYILKIDGAIHDGWASISDFEDKLSSDFLYHFLSSSGVQNYWISKINSGSVSNLNADIIKSLLIPIPCPDKPKKSLEIQAEIVRILDTFTEYTAELTAELTARKKQYSYYREQLLSFEEGKVEWKTLGEVGELVRGNGLPKTDFTETGVPAIHYGQIYTYYGTHTSKTISFVSPVTAKKLSKVNYGDVVITNTSENLEDVGKAVVYLGEEQAVTGGHATIFKPSKYISSKYLAYFTQTEGFACQKRKLAKGTKVIDVSAKDMSKILIPIPSLEEQERIVTFLDKFDILTTSISEGLPKEIELRKKQYEYYRDKLLTFK
jgi:type I restriction enzyme S subunit